MLRTILLGAAFVLLGSAAASACETIESKIIKLGACIDDTMWLSEAGQGDQEFLYYSNDDMIGFTIIPEQTEISSTDFRAAIIANANSAVQDGETVAIGSERVEMVGGKPWNVLEYRFEGGEQPTVNTVFYYAQPDFGAVQVIFWTSPDFATTAAYRAGQLMSTITVSQ